MNVRQQTAKLQKALITKGKIYRINTHQFYSEEQDRMITGYRVTERITVKNPKGEVKSKEIERLHTYSPVELLKWFAEEWRNVDEGESK